MSAETTWRRTWKPTLQSTSWQECALNEQNFLIKFLCSDKSYDFMITDNANTYSESLDEKQILQRTRKLNPSVEAPLHKILDHIKQHMDNPAAAKVSVKMGDERCTTTLETKLAGLPFVWRFVASPCELNVVSEHMTLPLMGMVAELLRRQAELFHLLHRKDKEIEDYKAQGSKVTRKHLQTAPFDATAFKDSMVTSQGFENGVSRLGQDAFSEDGKTLYSDVMRKHAWLTRPSNDDDEEPVSTSPVRHKGEGQSWSNRVPGSVVSPSVSPAKSPHKSASPDKAEQTFAAPIKECEIKPQAASQLDHNYDDRMDCEELAKFMDYIANCFEAKQVIENVERTLCEDGIVYNGKPTLPALERVLFNLACDETVAEGVLYCLTLKLNGQFITRYLESGTFVGFMRDYGASLLKAELNLSSLNMLRIHTAEDIAANVVTDTTRPGKRFIGLLEGNKVSVVNQVTLLRDDLIAANSRVELVNMVVHCTRKKPYRSKSKKRYFYIYPEDSDYKTKWNDELTSYARKTPANQEFLSNNPCDIMKSYAIPMTLAEQFDFLSEISNNHWAPYLRMDGEMSCCPNHLHLTQNLLYQNVIKTSEMGECRPKFYPTSLRNRILYFFFHPSLHVYGKAICKHWFDSVPQLKSRKSPVKRNILDSNFTYKTDEFENSADKRAKYERQTHVTIICHQ